MKRKDFAIPEDDLQILELIPGRTIKMDLNFKESDKSDN